MLSWEKVKISENHETFCSFYFPGHTPTQSCNKNSSSVQHRICQIYIWQKLERGQSVTKGGEHKAESWPNSKFCLAKSSIQGEGEHLQLPLRWHRSQRSQPVPVQIGGTKSLPALRVSGLNCFLGRTEKILNLTFLYQEDGTYLAGYRERANVNPDFEEVFLFHNKGRDHYSSCGAIAWKVGF